MSRSTQNKGRRRRRRWRRESGAAAVRVLPVDGTLGGEAGFVGRRRRVGGARGWNAPVGGAGGGKAEVAGDDVEGCSVGKKNKSRFSRKDIKKKKPGFWDDSDDEDADAVAPGAPLGAQPAHAPPDDAPRGPPADARAAALRDYLDYHGTVKVIMQNTRRQRFILQCPVVHISSEPTPEEIERFLEENAIALRNSPFSIPVMINGEVKHVPVTPRKPDNVEDYTHHIVVVTRYSDFTQTHIIVENHSGYIRGIKVVYLFDVAAKKPWMLFGNGEMPTRFGTCVRLDYSADYSKVEQVRLDEGVIPDLFDFYVSLDRDPKQKATPEGIILIMTGFVCFGETPRFSVAKSFFMEGVTRSRENPLVLPPGFPTLLRDWSVLSKLIFMLYLAILELRLLKKEGVSTPDANKAMAKAKQAWKKCQKVHKKLITFFIQPKGATLEETNIHLELLCGGQLQLLRHDDDSCDKVLLRLISYAGHWYRDIQGAFDAGRL